MDLIEEFLPSGTEVQYYSICHTKLWLFSHYIRMEDSSDEVLIGRMMHEDSYRREHKEVIVHGKIALDFVKNKDILLIHEIKKEYKLVEVHKLQLKYYLWYFRHIIQLWPVEGVIDYPAHKKQEKVVLCDQDELTIPVLIARIEKIILQPTAPLPKKIRACSKCAYFEICWV